MIHFNNRTPLLPVTLVLKFFLKFNYLRKTRFSFLSYCLILKILSEACSFQKLLVLCALAERAKRYDSIINEWG